MFFGKILVLELLSVVLILLYCKKFSCTECIVVKSWEDAKNNESDASKKDVSGKENTKEKKNNVESKKWLQIHKKKCFHLLGQKKKYNHNKIKPKILQNSMTNSYQQSHDDWRFMALDKCCCWLEVERWRKEKFKKRDNRSGKEDKRFEWSRMKCSRSNTPERSELVGWDCQELITLWASNSHTRPMSGRFYGPPCLWVQNQNQSSKK